MPLSLTADAQARHVGTRERVIFAVQSEYTNDTEGSMNVRIIQNAMPKAISVFFPRPLALAQPHLVHVVQSVDASHKVGSFTERHGHWLRLSAASAVNERCRCSAAAR